MIPAGITDDQAVELLDRQIEAMKTRLQAGEKIVNLCMKGCNVLQKSPPASLANISEVVGALREALSCLLESNLMANRLSLNEISQQCEQLEAARKQRTAKIHLGGFAVPASPRRG